MQEFLSAITPTIMDKYLLSIGAGIGAVMSFLFGETTLAIYWLGVFVAVDCITGYASAWKNHEVSSSTGFNGIIKKVLIFCIVALCHGLDVASVIPFVSLRDTAIFAFSLNEVGSILENIGKLGYGSIIPAPIRSAIKILNDKQQKKIEELKE